MYQPQYYSFTPSYFPKEAILHSEKQTIKRNSRIISIPLIILLVAMSFWLYPYFWIMGMFGFSNQQALDIIYNPHMLQVVQIVLSMTLFVIPLAITARACGNRISALIPFNAPQKEMILPFFLIGMGVCSFSNIGTAIAGGIFESFGFEYSAPDMEMPKGITGVLLSIVATAVVPALVEEFACRGIIHGLLERFGEGFAILTTSIIFGLMHGNFNQIFFAFTVGLVLGYVRVKTGSIWICVLIHFANNLISVVMSYLEEIVPSMVLSMSYLIYIVTALFLFIVGINMLKKWNGDFYKFKNPESICTTKNKYLWFFTSVPAIIFSIICLVEALSY